MEEYMTDFSQLLMFIPGIVIFLVASGQVREYRRASRPDATRTGSVKYSKHITKNDKYGRQVFDYFDTTIESVNPSTKKKERHVVKSPVEYGVNQQVSLYFDRVTGEPTLTNGVNEWLFHPWLGMVGGALLILLALFQMQGKQIPAMVCLALILIGSGAGMIGNYVSLKKKKLQAVPAEIIDIYERQISKQGRFSGGSKYTYYPVVKYLFSGVETMRRCNVNSSRKESFKIGDMINLYYSPSEDVIREKKENLFVLIFGAVVLTLGILAGVSILSVFY